MYYHVQINYFNSDSGEMTLLSECNIQDLDVVKEIVINPYVYGHSFKFCGIDLVLASVHQVRVYASEHPIKDINEDGVKEVTSEIIDSMKLIKDICLRKWMNNEHSLLPAQVDEQ